MLQDVEIMKLTQELTDTESYLLTIYLLDELLTAGLLPQEAQIISNLKGAVRARLTQTADISLVLRLVNRLNGVLKRQLTLMQLGRLVTYEHLAHAELVWIRYVVKLVNKYTQGWFSSYNSGVTPEVGRLLGLN